MKMLFELLGYTGLVLVMISLAQKNRERLHLYNLIGSALMFISAVGTRSFVFVIAQFVFIILNTKGVIDARRQTKRLAKISKR
jgi:hypothetical protein